MTIIVEGGGNNIATLAPQSPRHCLKEPARAHPEALRALLAHNAIANLQEHRYGWSALMMAAEVDASSAVKLLLSHGADTSKGNFAGEKAVDIARKAESATVLPLLDSP